MTCREAERLVMPYINGSITDEELKAFVEHIDHCPDCREELEIYFTVDVGIRQLDEGTGSYNIKGALEYPEESNRRFVYHIPTIVFSGFISLPLLSRWKIRSPFATDSKNFVEVES